MGSVQQAAVPHDEIAGFYGDIDLVIYLRKPRIVGIGKCSELVCMAR